MKSRSKRNQAGYTLIDMAISMTIIGLLLSGIMAGARVYIRDKQMSETREHIQVVAKAIDNYVLETGHFPCPAAITLDTDNPKYGSEADCVNFKGYTAAGAVETSAATAGSGQTGGIWLEESKASPTNYAVRGMVPFSALNLPDFYAYDGYGNRLQYVVTAKRTKASDFSQTTTTPAITVVDSQGVGGMEANHANTQNDFLVFSNGASQEGAWNRNGQMARACGAGLDGMNCKDGKQAIYMSARYSTANGADKFDDVVLGRASMHRPTWQAVASNKSDIKTIDDKKKVVIKTASGANPLGDPVVAANEMLRLDVVGDARAASTISNYYCRSGDGTNSQTACFKTDELLSKDGLPVTPFACPSGTYMAGIKEGKADCRSYMSNLCPIGQYAAQIQDPYDPDSTKRGMPICQTYNFTAGDPPPLIIGNCGTANYKSMSAQPSTDAERCSAGTFSGFTVGTGTSPSNPWLWSCVGSNDSATAYCKAYPSQPTTDGLCGPANATPTSSKPVAGLCSRGGASAVTGSGPWNWTCIGSNGGTNASCAASPLTVTAGVCGSAAGNATTKPATNLCSAGTASTVIGNGPWTWSCYGSNGGASAYCQAKKSVAGVCGLANGTGRTFKPDGTDLCLSGNPDPTPINENSTQWSWNCIGENGGSNASCSANKIMDGRCGSSAGQTLTAKPTTGLCVDNSSPTVSGSGPWTWTCKGNTAQGGTDANCSANSAGTCTGDTTPAVVSGSCGTTVNTCTQGIPGSYNPGACGGSATWSCQGSGGGSNASCSKANASCATVVSGSCGGTNNTCASGTPSSYNAGSCGGDATWICLGSNGGSNAACNKANAACVTPVNGACGGSPGACSAGAPKNVNNGSCGGSTTWTCEGQNGGVNVACSSANAACVTPVNGACGSANNTCTLGTPASYSAGSCNGSATWSCQGANGGTTASCSKANAACPVDGVCGGTAMTCSAGTASNDGGQSTCGTNRTWQCQGLNGGNTASCSKANPVCVINGSCGSANGTTVASAPSANLCSTGTQSSVSGSGPWTWTCNGSGGGGNASCSANKSAPTTPTCTATPLYCCVGSTCGTGCPEYYPGAYSYTGPYKAVATIRDTTGVSHTITASCTGQSCTNSASQTIDGTTYTVNVVQISDYRYSAGSISPSAPAACSGGVVNGACGADNGSTSIPNTGPTQLCNSGTSSTVISSNSVPTTYTWSCVGSGGGTTASCSGQSAAASLKTWQPMGSYATYVGSMAKMDMDCGAVQPAACQGCTSFPAVTCTPGDSCNETKTCLINQTTCHMSSGGNATQWDRYTCR